MPDLELKYALQTIINQTRSTQRNLDAHLVRVFARTIDEELVNFPETRAAVAIWFHELAEVIEQGRV